MFYQNDLATMKTVVTGGKSIAAIAVQLRCVV
jgi:hypothetical protein